MATVINNPDTRTPVVADSGTGWAIAIIVLVAAVLIGLFVWPGFVNRSAPTDTTPGTNVNVTLPQTGTEPAQ